MSEFITIHDNPVGAAARFTVIHKAAMKHGAWNEQAFAELCAQPGVFAMCHRYDSQDTDGFLLARVVADECEILTLAVLPGAQRAGVATHLLGGALWNAHERGATSCFLEVAESNVPAITLYKRWEFAVAGHRKDYYQLPEGEFENAVVMRLALNSSVFD